MESRSRISIAKPRRIASHATRKSVLPNPALAWDVAELASAVCWVTVIISTPLFSLHTNHDSRRGAAHRRDASFSARESVYR